LSALQRAQDALINCPDLAERVSAVYVDDERDSPSDPEYALYDGFINDADRRSSERLQHALRNGNAWINGEFTDPRLTTLSQRLKARVRPDEMDEKERRAHLDFVRQRLAGATNKLDAFMLELQICQENGSQDMRDSKIVEALISHAENLRALYVENASNG